ncbi:hypothetical protein [Flavobacterium flavigenum]|uniref:hypothetical protein n=1 Tax=Flavobacterium flavigenum TaxID=3003258 RepID=UPI0022ABECAA|nr:hypothetical protein [Flavobacterium flavigenum]
MKFYLINFKRIVFLQLLFCLPIFAQNIPQKINNEIADKPLYRDPVFDGAADPTIIWSKKYKKWLMFYTNRRANISGNGVSWVHGTPIGIAKSEDGAHWKHKTNCNIGYSIKDVTYWAPEVI